MVSAKKMPKSGIRIADSEAIEDYLKSVNGRACSFVATASELQRAAEKAEGDLEDARLPKAERTGIELRYRTAGPWANAYRYSVIGNEALLKRFRGGWRLLDVKTISVHPRQTASTRVLIMEKHAAEIRRRCLTGFEVITAAEPVPSLVRATLQSTQVIELGEPGQQAALATAA